MYLQFEKRHLNSSMGNVLQAVSKRKPAKSPKMYTTIRGGNWNDEEGMYNHCFAYCDESQAELVLAARLLGLLPPMLGHGSGKTKGGTAKDALLWASFQAYMEWFFETKGIEGRTTSKKAQNVIKMHKK